MIIWLIFSLFLQTKPNFSLCLPGPSWTCLLLRNQSLWCLKVINLTIVGFFKSGLKNFKLLDLCGNQLISIPYSCLCLCSFRFWGKYSSSWIWNNIGRNCLLGHRKEYSQIFNKDFYLPLYLPLWIVYWERVRETCWFFKREDGGGGGGAKV